MKQNICLIWSKCCKSCLITTFDLLPISVNSFKKSLTFLGYAVSADGVRPPTERVKAIGEFPLPDSATDLRRFMGMLNFFRQMIPNFANIAFPVTELLRLFPKCKTLPWTDESIDSFNKLKQALVQCPTLKYPSSDSSNHAVGAALYQCIDGTPHPISFFSKKLSQTVANTKDLLNLWVITENY